MASMKKAQAQIVKRMKAMEKAEPKGAEKRESKAYAKLEKRFGVEKHGKGKR